MIPFGSQRASGQDLATHLLNAQDNERLELAQVRGAIARDLHGAFAEWEAQAHALTRCRKYLYSLSVNPDPRQGGLTREQYFDYIARVEERLGLKDQPRAIVFHEKHGRKHCHVVWSRIDAAGKRAVQISFDREKLMAVTREFAHDHGLNLPDGYYRDQSAKQEKNRQLSLYEKHQQDTTGLTKEERIAEVTSAWRQSDSARAFVRALEEHGYILATGKRDYVLVDRYGAMNSLPKLINDPQVRTRQVREFFARDFPVSALPSVDAAREIAAQRREAVAERSREQQGDDQKLREIAHRAALELKQASRRHTVEQQAAALAARQTADRKALFARQLHERAALRTACLAEIRGIRQERRRNRPTGLAAFLARVCGIALITKKLHRYRDRERHRAFLAQKAAMHERQVQEQTLLARRHDLQALDLQRRTRALVQVERRERRSLEIILLREARTRARNEPSVDGRDARQHEPEPASAFRKEWTGRADPAARPGRRIDLRAQFGRAAEDDDEGKGGGASGAPAPVAEAKIRRRRRRRDYRRAFNKASGAEGGGSGETGEGDSFGEPKPASERKTRRRRRRKIQIEPEFNSAADPGRGRGGDALGGPDPPRDNNARLAGDPAWPDERDFDDEIIESGEPDDGPDEIDEMVWDDALWNSEPDDGPPAPRPRRKRNVRPK